VNERDYILATNLARVRLILDLLRAMTPCDGFTPGEVRTSFKRAAIWEENLASAINEAMADDGEKP
jgi:hypothetical protein